MRPGGLRRTLRERRRRRLPRGGLAAPTRLCRRYRTVPVCGMPRAACRVAHAAWRVLHGACRCPWPHSARAWHDATPRAAAGDPGLLARLPRPTHRGLSVAACSRRSAQCRAGPAGPLADQPSPAQGMHAICRHRTHSARQLRADAPRHAAQTTDDPPARQDVMQQRGACQPAAAATE